METPPRTTSESTVHRRSIARPGWLPWLLLVALAVAPTFAPRTVTARQAVPGRQEVPEAAVGDDGIRVWGGAGFGDYFGQEMLVGTYEIAVSKDGWMGAIVGSYTGGPFLPVLLILTKDGDVMDSVVGLLVGRVTETNRFHASVSGGPSVLSRRTWRRNSDECSLFCSGEFTEPARRFAIQVEAQAFLKLGPVGIGAQLYGTVARGGHLMVGPAFRLGKLW